MEQNSKAEPSAAASAHRSSRPDPAGLYVHIPFCVRKCPYCDFYSVTGSAYVKPFLNALILEMGLYRRLPLAFDTLYIGGGTPSMLDEQGLARIIDTAYACFSILEGAEITLEVNPGAAHAAGFAVCRRLHINRLNIGVQSFDDRNLKLLGRIHSAKDAAATIGAARRAGFDNIGLDLIYGLPGQTPDAWRADLEKALMFAPEHLSCYLLTYEPGTVFARRRAAGRLRPLDEDLCGDLFAATGDYLARRGYRQYEVSNFARESGLESRHNQKYWSLTPYIGLGPSAHSFIEPVRYWNPRDLQKYISQAGAGRLPLEKSEVLSSEQQMIEMIYLGLRTAGGIDLNAFALKFGVHLQKACRQTIVHLEEEGLTIPDANRLKLSTKGMCLSDGIAASLIDCCL